MTSMLKQAFDKASELPSDAQDGIAKGLIDDIESELRWERAVEACREKLEKLAVEEGGRSWVGKTRSMGFDEA